MIPILFIISRIADTLSTLNSVGTYGADLETNPLVRQVIENGAFIPYQLILTLLVLLGYWKLPKIFKPVTIGLTILSFIVAASNIISFL